MKSPFQLPVIRKIVTTLSKNPVWGLAIAIIVALISNILTVVYIQSLQKDLQSMYKEGLIGQNYIQSARISLYSLDNLLCELFLVDADARNAVIGKIATCKRDFESLLHKSKRLYRSKKEAAQIVLVRKTFAECRADIDTLVLLSALDQKARASEMITGRMADRFHKADSLLDNIDNNKMKHDISLFKDIDYQLTISIFFTLLMLFATIGFKAIVYWFKRPHGPRVTRLLRSIPGMQPNPEDGAGPAVSAQKSETSDEHAS